MKLERISTSDLFLIRSKIKLSDISSIRRDFTSSLSPSYIIRSASRYYTFYIVPKKPDKILISIQTMRIGLSFPLDPFTVTYLQGSGLTPIQLTPNS